MTVSKCPDCGTTDYSASLRECRDCSPIAALHASAVERVMRAWDEGHPELTAGAWDITPFAESGRAHWRRRRADFEAAITTALAAPAPSELLEHAVKMAMEAVDLADLSATDPCVEPAPWREHFARHIRERLAQSASIAACNLATNKDAAELLSAAEWLDKRNPYRVEFDNGIDAEFSWKARGGTEWTGASSLRLAILAAARSLGWEPGGVK